MLNNKTKKELKKMKFDDLKNMFELLTDDTEKKEAYINYMVTSFNNNDLIQKLIKVR